MADVIDRSSGGHTDRGQLLLLSGIGLAALLVMLALVLNGAIYTENVAARDSEARETLDVTRFHHETIDVTESLLRMENERPADDYATMEANLSRELGDWSNLSAQHYAKDAGVVWVTVEETQHGSHIAQDTERELTNRNNTSTWTVVEGATAVPIFRMTADRSSLVELTGTQTNVSDLVNESVFAIEFDSATGTEHVFVYATPGKVVLHHADTNGDLSAECSTTGQTATIDFVAGTLDGDVCGSIEELLPLESATDISFESGSNGRGTYELIVDQEAIDADLNDGAGLDPYGERLLYNATVSIRYATPDLEYANTGVAVSGGDWP